jgi:2-iminobutanoate/2-iminopropanoate deaminase
MRTQEVIMTLKVIQTDHAPKAIGPYSQGIAVEPWLFVSGQLGIQPETGELVSSDFGPQARQALENLVQIVKAAGYELKHVVAVDVFVTDLNHFAAFNDIYAEYFSAHRPARAVVEVCRLPRDAIVEIKCIACRAPEAESSKLKVQSLKLMEHR